MFSFCLIIHGIKCCLEAFFVHFCFLSLRLKKKLFLLYKNTEKNLILHVLFALKN